MKDFFKFVLIIVLLAVAGFSFWKMTKSKHVKTSNELKREYDLTCDRILIISRAIDAMLEEHGRIPQVTSINEVKGYAENYVNKCPTKDYWGNELFYRAIDNMNFEIASAGSDGVFDGFDQKGEYSEYGGQDIIIDSGIWKFAPKFAKIYGFD